MNARQRKSVLLTTIVSACFSMLLFFLALKKQWFGSFDGTADVFCEATHKGLIKQPVNTWSNLAFMLAGLSAAWQIFKGKYAANVNPITRSIFYSTFICVFMVLLCPGSMAMHATMTTVGGFFDMLSMYLIASFMMAYAIKRLFSLGIPLFLGTFGSAMVLCLIAHFLNLPLPFVHFSGNGIFALFVLLASCMEGWLVFIRKGNYEKKYGLLAIVSILSALTIWNLSQTGAPLCDPSSLVQGHGIWHILDATALFFLFRFYVSEHNAIA
ncbi:MAG: ceramidase [Chitinophagales bacterium]|nr:ceramidase [Chitinophagales bacterium]